MSGTDSTKHTPGTWKVEPVFINQSPGTPALHFGEYRLELPQPGPYNTTLPREVAFANAALFAAAPEMLSTLKAHVDRCPMCAAGIECQDDLCYADRAAISKAEEVKS